MSKPAPNPLDTMTGRQRAAFLRRHRGFIREAAAELKKNPSTISRVFHGAMKAAELRATIGRRMIPHIAGNGIPKSMTRRSAR